MHEIWNMVFWYLISDCLHYKLCAYIIVISWTVFSFKVEYPIIENFKKQLGTHEIESSALQIQEPIGKGKYL